MHTAMKFLSDIPYGYRVMMHTPADVCRSLLRQGTFVCEVNDVLSG